VISHIVTAKINQPEGSKNKPINVLHEIRGRVNAIDPRQYSQNQLSEQLTR